MTSVVTERRDPARGGSAAGPDGYPPSSGAPAAVAESHRRISGLTHLGAVAHQSESGATRARASLAAADAPPFAADAAEAYRELAPAVLGYLRARRAPDPEDVLGEVFLQVSRDLGRFAGDATDLRRWVFTIARNRMTDAFRRRARRPQVVDRAPPVLAAPAAPEPVDDELIAALQELGDDQREVVVLRFVADLSLEDVAAITGRNVNAVKAMQHRALANLRQVLAPR